MSLTSQYAIEPDSAVAALVGVKETWPPASQLERHAHRRDQLMYSRHGAVHVITDTGRWILPPTRAIWIRGGTLHAFEAKRPVDLTILYIEPEAAGSPRWPGCAVVNVSPLVRELIFTAADLDWNFTPDSPSGRIARVLLEQLEALSQAPLDLPTPKDSRTVKLAEWLKAHPENRSPTAALASQFGLGSKTLERLFANEAGMSFGAWRLRLRMIAALEQLAHGDSVSNVAFTVGYESASSFISTFREMFGTTPSRYFDLLSKPET